MKKSFIFIGIILFAFFTILINFNKPLSSKNSIQEIGYSDKIEEAIINCTSCNVCPDGKVIEKEKICVYLFFGQDCPHCAREKIFLEKLIKKYPNLEIYYFEVYHNFSNVEFWKTVCQKYNTQPSAVPMTFIGNKVFVGFVDRGFYSSFNLIPAIIFTIFFILVRKLKFILPAFLLVSTTYAQELYHPILGDITKLPIILIGVIAGLSDGILNPCALSVLFFMVAYMLALGSRKKLLKIGIFYSITIFLVYFFFMYLLLNAISLTSYYLGYTWIIRYVLGAIVIAFGIIEVKEFFFFGKGFSLEIPKFAKPKIEKLIKSATIPSAILLGFLVSLVEIPCAGAFPLFYASFLSTSIFAGNLSWIEAIFYLVWYNIFFVLPLLILTLVFYFGFLKIEEAERKRIKLRKYMRLITGIILIVLGIAFLVAWI
ncbi:MAG: GAP family protein [Candidatus Aenigmatarchaeota archaeon]